MGCTAKPTLWGPFSSFFSYATAILNTGLLFRGLEKVIKSIYCIACPLPPYCLLLPDKCDFSVARANCLGYEVHVFRLGITTTQGWFGFEPLQRLPDVP